MQAHKAAARYARAILSLAQDKQADTAVNEDMQLIEQTVSKSADLQDFLKNPTLTTRIKKETLKEIFKNVNPVTLGLFDVLIENNRLLILASVASRYIEFYNDSKGTQVAKVTTAIPLTPALEEKIQKKVKELTGNVAKIENIVDESIIGGFILRVGDIQYNGSVKSRLHNLQRELQDKTYVSKLN